ncbi:MAG TPA: ABC transporter permease [Myxococcota bacterium]|nr:ABC transporter permease [Myxococcota bacterium]
MQSRAADDLGLTLERVGADTLRIRLAGDWVGKRRASEQAVEERLASEPGLRRVAFDATALGRWDTSLLIFLAALRAPLQKRAVAVDTSGLPDGVRGLLQLAFAVPARTDTGRPLGSDPLLVRIGKGALRSREGLRAGVAFLGEAVLSVGRCLRGRAQLRGADLGLFVQSCGAEAVGIVSLINFLVGLILGYVSVQQLAYFAAQIYTADLVAIAVARELGPIMTGIIMAGRTGAAFAAQLGTMTVNQEIDALSTLGVSAFDFLVLPRMLALIVMFPLLCLYADVVGIFGGAVAAVPLGDIAPLLYWEHTSGAPNLLRHVAIGVGKSVVFGIIVALSGCLRGIQSGRSAQAVGDAATSAVVTAIVLIIVADAVFAVVFATVGI